MPSRALFRVKKELIKHLSNPPRPCFTFSRFGHGRPLHKLDFCFQELELIPVFKEHLLNFMPGEAFKRPPHGVSIGFHGRKEFLPLGAGYLLQSIHNASSTAADRPKIDEEFSKKEKQKKIGRTLAEEQDQAVEGMSGAKAKVKAKEVHKTTKYVILKLRSKVLGIGLAMREVAFMSRVDWGGKLRRRKDKFVSTMKHYRLGLNLLWMDVRISSRLLLKMAGGKNLSRTERHQLMRTTADIFRLVPFAVFIIVPFMEFLLPVFLKVFPNMLPSTFRDKMKKEEKLKRKIIARMEYANFLQEIVKEMAKEVKCSSSGEMKQTAVDLVDFLNKVRKGAPVSNEEILGFAKLFDDELTLDNISRPRLLNMCKYMGIQPYGTDENLRHMLRKKLHWIKDDDKLIQAEGVESLSEEELRQACRERGYLALLSTDEMRHQLRDWLDLSLNHSLPSSLLILSRAFTLTGKMKPEEAVVATLSSLPDEVVVTVSTTLPSEDSVSEWKKKLELLEMQEQLIKEEEEKAQQKFKMKESGVDVEDVALTTREAEVLDEVKTLGEHELCKISCALAVLASASSVSGEHEEFLRLIKKEIELYNTMLENEDTKHEEDAKKAYRAARTHAADAAGYKVSRALIDRVDAMLQELEKEIDDVDAKISDRWQLLDRDYDGKVTPEEVAAAAMYLKDHIGQEGVQKIISNLSRDKEGKILVEDIVRLGTQIDKANGDGA